jgi:hypothetical protein
MALSDGDRVVLQRDRQPHGRVMGSEYGGKAYVRLDNGTAASFETTELAPETEDKSWPPKSIETK